MVLRIWCLLRFASSRLSTPWEHVYVRYRLCIFYRYKLSLSQNAKILFVSFFNLSTFLFWNKCWEVETYFVLFFVCLIGHILFDDNLANYILFIDHLKTFIFDFRIYVLMIILQKYIIYWPFKDLYIRFQNILFDDNLAKIYFAYTIYRVESYNMEGYGLRIWCLLRFASSRLSTPWEHVSGNHFVSMSYREMGEISGNHFVSVRYRLYAFTDTNYLFLRMQKYYSFLFSTSRLFFFETNVERLKHIYFLFFRVWLDIYFLLIILHILFIDHLKTFIFELLLSLQIIYVAYTIYRIESYNMEGYGFAYLMLASLRIFTLVYPIGTRIW